MWVLDQQALDFCLYFTYAIVTPIIILGSYVVMQQTARQLCKKSTKLVAPTRSYRSRFK